MALGEQHSTRRLLEAAAEQGAKMKTAAPEGIDPAFIYRGFPAAAVADLPPGAGQNEDKEHQE